ncbi:hypothetical protein CR513_38305, partial [Mucuna pruriens]
MLNKGSSNIGSAMVIRKCFTKGSIGSTNGSTYEGKLFTKKLTKDTCYKLYGKEKVLKQMGGNKDPTQMWVNQTTSDKENVVKHPCTLQLD